MLIYTHHYWVEYGDQVRGCDKRYAVTDHRTSPRKYVFGSDLKSECIAKAQELNHFTPVNGNEQTYAQQCKDAMREHTEVRD